MVPYRFTVGSLSAVRDDQRQPGRGVSQSSRGRTPGTSATPSVSLARSSWTLSVAPPPPPSIRIHLYVFRLAAIFPNCYSTTRPPGGTYPIRVSSLHSRAYIPSLDRRFLLFHYSYPFSFPCSTTRFTGRLVLPLVGPARLHSSGVRDLLHDVAIKYSASLDSRSLVPPPLLHPR